MSMPRPFHRSCRVRGAVLATLALALWGGVAASAGAAVTVKDLRNRTVTLPAPATRLAIDDGRFLVALALIHDDPVSVVAAWPRDVNRLGQATYDRLLAKSPRLAGLPQVASSASTFSLELVLAARPDVAVFSLGRGPDDAQVALLERAGIPVVFVDFFVQPFEHAERSVSVLGALVGREKRATEFIAFRRERLQAIQSRVAASSAPRPRVFLEAHAGMSADCCNSPGKGNVGDYIEFVGGHNIGADVLPGPSGRLNVEYILSRDPAVYILTGGPHLEKTGGLVVGTGYTTERARRSLVAMSQRPVLSRLRAVREGRVHGLAHQLLNSPLDLPAIEALARWIRPDLFGSLDPAATVRTLNERFLAVPLEGDHWVSLK